MSKRLLEVCIDSLSSARAAMAGGADRIELCSALPLGGLTPYTALLEQIRSESNIPVRCLMRPRAGDFLYTPEEIHMMAAQIRALKAAGADGFVIGCLDARGRLDKTAMAPLVEACGGVAAEDALIKAGGPMMGFPQNTLDTPIMKGSNGIIAIDKDETEPNECIKCGRCVDVCPMELKPLYYYKHAIASDWQTCKDMNIMDCMECRCCEYICSSKLPLVNMIKMGKNGVRGLK